MLTLIAAVAAIALGDTTPPDLRVPAAGLRLSDPADAREFAGRVAERTRAYCAANLERITPEHLADPSVCERGMADLVVASLSEAHRRDFHRSGGRRVLNRLQR